ncbi:MAG TPA: YihY family inner membrane protein [Oligoflexus sp.]|uniref:YihY/virulence factor BrkB family protein n=1 Tax=Oligoflexus sp. TaxID=1971216 RepID=UPI002D7E7A0E|nr:YihY family inner membrane protein [Oligoflexus sp.]HET9237740.1 YihY family inner membrane protein [Oligoflexus sp.]
MSNLSSLQSFKQRLAHTKVPVSLGRFWSFLRTLAEDIGQTNLLIHASSMAYMTLGSIIPLLALTFAIVSAFQPIAVADADWLASFKVFILENLAPQSGENMVRVLETFLANLDVAKIGLTGFLTLIVLIILLLRDIEVALNSIWQVPQTRSFLKRFMFFWITTTLGALCLSIVFAAFSRVSLFDGASIEEVIPSDALATFINVLATFIFFTVLQKIGPNCHVSLKAAAVGGLVATVMIRLASKGFAFYSAHSAWNQDIYEALAVVPLFLLWLYLGWFVILFSAIIAWRTHHGFGVQRAHEAGRAGRAKRGEHEAIQLRDLHIRSMLPLICVLMAGVRFLEAKGEGVQGRQLAVDLDIPPYWVREALQIAEERGLLLIKRPPMDKTGSENDVLELMAYPSVPLDRISMDELLQKLTHETQEWVRSRPAELSVDLEGLLKNAFVSLGIERQQPSLAALLESAASPKRTMPVHDA